MWTMNLFSRLQGFAFPWQTTTSIRRIAISLVVLAMTSYLSFLPGGAQLAEAQEVALPTQGSQLIFGAAITKTRNDSPVKNEETLKNRPIGMHVFKTLAEVDDPDALKPGAKVDVMLTAITEGETKSDRILRKVTVYSVGEWTPNDAILPGYSASEEKTSSDEESEVDQEEGSVIKPQRVVGLLVNGAQLETLRVADAQGVLRLKESEADVTGGAFGQIWHNFKTNLFQPLLLFFFMGFSVPLLKVPFDFPKPLYQSLTIYLLIAIGWHGGELMAQQSSAELAVAGGLIVIGFFVNAFIGVLATKILEWFTPMRKIDAVTVGAYYGSDSAGTFVTCLGILATLGILYDSYMPVLLAVMEIPGCLVGLYLVSRLRHSGMDKLGNMPGEPEYNPHAQADQDMDLGVGHTDSASHGSSSVFSWKIAHEVFLNPGLFMLFGGIIVGFISGYQALEDPHVVEGPNHLFIFIFKGALCLFLLEMGMTACRRLRDLKTAGWGFIAFGLLAPNVFATIGMLALHAYSVILGHPFYLGTYALFAVLCGAASYIAVPAVQRLAIPEASPTLPLAASLGLTFTWNVTMGIPIYIEIAKAIIAAVPVV